LLGSKWRLDGATTTGLDEPIGGDAAGMGAARDGAMAQSSFWSAEPGRTEPTGNFRVDSFGEPATERFADGVKPGDRQSFCLRRLAPTSLARGALHDYAEILEQRFAVALALNAILVAAYAAAGTFGLRLAVVHPSATPVWPPTGIAVAALLVLGYRVWPGILLGAFLVNLPATGAGPTTIGIAVGNTLEGLAGAYLVNRFAGGWRAFERPRDILRFSVLAALASTMVSATIGVASLALGGFASGLGYGSVWFTWWLGDACGALVVAPMLVLWATAARPRWDRRRLGEAAVVLLALVLVGQAVFGGWFPGRGKDYPLDFLCIPVLVWVAFRFGQREAATAICILSGIAIWGTLRGFGPFVRETPNESLLLLQAFSGVTGVLTLAFAAVVAESRRGEDTRARLATIVDSSHDAIIGQTPDGTITSWNPGAAALYGYDPVEVVGRSISFLAPPDRRDEVSAIIARMERGEHVAPFETTHQKKDGTDVTVALTISPIEDTAGRLVGACTIARDVTERARLEEAARNRAALDAVKRLANTAAHEINNPLAVIFGNIELVEKRLEPGSYSRARLRRALESGEAIHQTVTRMQQITRLEVIDQPAHLPEVLDLGQSTPRPRER
jgi:PAS domain S-box-containing protein